MWFHVKEKKLNIRQTEMNYIAFGTGDRTLIMIQGLNTNGIKGAGLSLAYLYRIFSKDYTVYLFDRRKEIRDGMTVKEMAMDVAAAMDTLGLDHVDILGVSLGGMIAQYLAIERPDLVRKMVLAVTAARTNSTLKTVIENWIRLTEQGRWKELVRDMAETMYSEEYVKRYRLLMPLLTILQKPKDVPRFIRLAKSCLTCDTYDMLEKIQCPVFVIGGRKDRIVGGESSDELAEKLGCQCFVYEQLGHAAYEEAKDFNSRVYAFLKQS